jgi:hypothetical protein
LKCWFCSKEGDLVDFAYVESPTRPVIEAHAECPSKFGFGEALVPVKK